jgi:hypothetical protein
VISARELHESFPPMLDEIDWARERIRSEQGLLALVVFLDHRSLFGQIGGAWGVLLIAHIWR